MVLGSQCGIEQEVQQNCISSGVCMGLMGKFQRTSTILMLMDVESAGEILRTNSLLFFYSYCSHTWTTSLFILQFHNGPIKEHRSKEWLTLSRAPDENAPGFGN
ncbi:hypothetical protein RHSIM_Rhsim03G0115200 [Rhododendron simsii]|uniref:Uncharacterized protein n=1 Tax=Rhododendron simsii TaxID=118357 RepID=A0A834LP95_RHOSS|nr:hypothetical protein RHSIM_Rhsim03G0115200 [Rhododendron simsii]